MPDFQVWLAFVVASTVILVIPGPTIILVVSQVVAHGRPSVIPLVAGVLLGDFVAMTLSLLGLGALMATSAVLFTLFKWVGAGYLIFLGLKLWMVNPQAQPLHGPGAQVAKRSHLRDSFVVTALNPKSIAFFVAFMPQFVHVDRPVSLQFLTLGATFLTLAVVNAALYAIFAERLSLAMQRERVRRWFNRCGGSALIGAGIVTAGLRRA